jgi:hypothetical protein
MRFSTPVYVVLLVIVAIGCQNDERSPEDVYTQYFGHITGFSLTQNKAYQDAAFKLLSPASQDLLKERAEVVNHSLPEGADLIKPQQMLIPLRTPLGRRVKDIERISDEDSEVRLKVTFERGTDEVEMIRGEQGWRVELPIQTSNPTGP